MQHQYHGRISLWKFGCHIRFTNAIFKLVMIIHNKKLNLASFQHSITYYIHVPNIEKLYFWKVKEIILLVSVGRQKQESKFDSVNNYLHLSFFQRKQFFDPAVIRINLKSKSMWPVVQRLRNRYYCLFWVDQAKNKKILPRAKKNKQTNKQTKEQNQKHKYNNFLLPGD